VGALHQPHRAQIKDDKMTQEEIKKLAEWAGFTWRKDEWLTPVIDCKYSDSRYRFPCDLPNFPEDETACFKWLVPEALRKFGAVKLFDLLVHWLRRIIFFGENPASTLCEAILKLVEAEDGS